MLEEGRWLLGADLLGQRMVHHLISGCKIPYPKLKLGFQRLDNLLRYPEA